MLGAEDTLANRARVDLPELIQTSMRVQAPSAPVTEGLKNDSRGLGSQIMYVCVFCVCMGARRCIHVCACGGYVSVSTFLHMKLFE